MFGGDVQRLPNGNTLGTYPVSGVIMEINPAGEVVQTITTPTGDTFGHSMFRESLYGPPPRIYDFEGM